ncbi:MAG: DEAD/DEAH box helicase family protein [Chryseolinea sp.]
MSKPAPSMQLSFFFPLEEKAKIQERANKIPLILKDLQNIQQTVPILIPHQAENTLKTERRFFTPAAEQLDGLNKGMMFTDGTGTGKTFVGLGIMKRFKRQMMDDMLVVVPTDAKVKDWIDDAKFFGLNLRQLKDTKDGGFTGSMVITTYANFRANSGLKARVDKKPFNLVIYDECHKLTSNESGSMTEAELVHKQLTYAPDEARLKAMTIYADALLKAKKDINGKEKEVLDAIERKTQELIDATKVVFLSATPFSYHKNLSYADGYLFAIKQGLKGDYQAKRDANNQFFVDNFGYRVMYHKLTEPDAKVDQGMLERAFHTKLLKAGVVSSTRLKLDRDYSREFILVDDKMGMMIDEGYQIATDSNSYRFLPDVIRERFSFLYEMQMLECIKARKSVDRIRKHLELGRKVVVFHSFNNSLPGHPFDLSDRKLWGSEHKHRGVNADIIAFNSKYPQYKALDLSGLSNPIDTITKAFGDKVVVFNGTVAAKDRVKIKKLFNQDDSGKDVIVVQMEAGKEGLSLHDTTGKKARVLLNLALPTKPTDAIQSEGRIYRIGQKTDAIVEYPVLHLNFEKITFATKINERAKTAENLAFGEQARNLKDAFKEGYKTPIVDDPHLGQGTGSRDADFVFDELAPFELAKKLYFNRGKRNDRTKSREGTDYFATPEPLGYMMAYWLYPNGGDHLLEPSAGHGAIARFFPDNTKNKFIEPSYSLRADLSINSMGEIIPTNFEDMNIVNKFDAIAMNPPFGTAGMMAQKHLWKACTHLRDGGRIIIIIPDGPAMDNRMEKFGRDDDTRGCFITAEMRLPAVTFERAGTTVYTRLLVIDKQTNINVSRKLPIKIDHDLRDKNLEQLFDSLVDIDMPIRLKAMSSTTSDGEIVGEAVVARVVPNIHTKTGRKLWTVQVNRRLSQLLHDRITEESKRYGGYYSSYDLNGAIAGWIFFNPEGATRLNLYVSGLFSNGTIEHEGRRLTPLPK